MNELTKVDGFKTLRTLLLVLAANGDCVDTGVMFLFRKCFVSGNINPKVNIESTTVETVAVIFSLAVKDFEQGLTI